MNKKKTIVNIQETGGHGKSHKSTGQGDVLRNVFNKECAIFLLDMEQTVVLNRLGERKENGKLVVPQKDPIKGVVSFDILNQANVDEATAYREGKRLLDSFSNDYEYSVYDFPGQGRSAFQKLFKADELAVALDVADKEVIVSIPIIEKKSVINLPKIREMFTFTGEWEHVNDLVKFVVTYNPINEKTDLTFNDYLNTKEHAEFSKLGNRYEVAQLANIDPNFLAMVEDKPFTHYYNIATNKVQNLTDEMKDYGVVNATIQLRRILMNDTGFIKFVENHIL